MTNTVDSNSTQYWYCEEVYGSPGTISTPVWYTILPNSVSKFGGSIQTVARSYLNPSRQKGKGVTVDRDAGVQMEEDFTQSSHYDRLQGFFFADWRNKLKQTPSAVDSTKYTVASSTGAVVGSLVFGSGFTNSGNNGLHKVSSTTGTTITVGSLTSETPPATAKLEVVGVEVGSGDLGVTVSGTTATFATTTLDMTTLGLAAGEWIFVGGDTSGTKFATAASNGWYRIQSVAANSMVCDRIPTSAATDSGSGKTVRVFFGHVIHNEDTSALQKKRSYRFQRFLSTNNYETVDTAYANTLTLSIRNREKVTATIDYIGGEVTTASAVEATGSYPSVTAEGALNGTSHVKFLKMYDDSNSAALFNYVSDLTVTINNNMTGVKAVSVLGNLDVTAGDFSGSASCTAFYTTNDATEAIAANSNVSLAGALVKDNAGWLFDLPLTTVSGEVKVDKDQPITVPLNVEGARHGTLTWTLLMQQFPYLPDLAE